jgi:acyl dehydratase
MATNAEQAVEILKKEIGTEEPPGEWLLVDQTRIDQFADATLDHQFIHVDPERAKQTPFGTTIAHGFLTLSLIVHLQSSIRGQTDPKAYQGLAMGVNYGLDRVRFMSPVKSGKRIRARRTLVSAELVNPNTVQLKQKVTVEIEGEPKAACIAESLTRLIYS